MVQFCPECSNLLRKKIENGKAYLVCKCGYQEFLEISIDQEVVQKKREALDKNLIIVNTEDKISVYPIVKNTCPKCDHNEAETWQIQIRSSDEPSTHFFRCVKCKYSWREE
ncbi:MAG: transcription factor S [Candidatus Thorarchaeota archaeon]